MYQQPWQFLPPNFPYCPPANAPNVDPNTFWKTYRKMQKWEEIKEARKKADEAKNKKPEPTGLRSKTSFSRFEFFMMLCAFGPFIGPAWALAVIHVTKAAMQQANNLLK